MQENNSPQENAEGVQPQENQPNAEMKPQGEQVGQQPVPQAPQTQAPVQEVSEQAQPVNEENPIAKGLQDLAKPAPNQPKVSSDDKLWGFISYLPMIGAILALILKPESDYIKLHGRQGLLIFIFFFFNIFIYLFPYIGPVLGIIVHFGLLMLGLYSMYQALIGNWWKIPVLGDIAEMIPTDLFVKVTREAVMGPENIEKNQATVDSEQPTDQPSAEAAAPAQDVEQKNEVPEATNPEAKQPASGENTTQANQ